MKPVALAFSERLKSSSTMSTDSSEPTSAETSASPCKVGEEDLGSFSGAPLADDLRRLFEAVV